MKDRTLIYRRASWLNDGTEFSLFDLISSTLEQKSTIANTRQISASGQNIDIRHRRLNEDTVLVHAVAYVPNEAASVVPEVQENVSEADLDTLRVDDGDFMDADFMALIKNNHVIMCLNGMRENQAAKYLRDLIRDIHDNDLASFELLKIADIDKANILRTEGVKSIDLNMALFDATLNQNDRVHNQARSGLSSFMRSLATKDLTRQEIEASENLMVKLHLSIDGRKKSNTLVGEERLKEIANTLVSSEEDDGFAILTKEGKTIRQDEISLSKKVRLEDNGAKSVSYLQAWQALGTYFNELEENGSLEL